MLLEKRQVEKKRLMTIVDYESPILKNVDLDEKNYLYNVILNTLCTIVFSNNCPLIVLGNQLYVDVIESLTNDRMDMYYDDYAVKDITMDIVDNIQNELSVLSYDFSRVEEYVLNSVTERLCILSTIGIINYEGAVS